LGKSTKLFGQFEAFDKAYRATLILGQKTTTADIEGDVVVRADYHDVTREKVADVFQTFIGETEQTPPMVSAIKVNGSRLYQLARKGLEVKREARKIVISDLVLLRFAPPQVEFLVACSKGTYVRKLAEDIGEKLGTVACIAEIERTKVGPFHIEDSVTLEAVTENDIRPWDPRVLPADAVSAKIF
jgi:tRNA pseudouridine55 synthase